MVIIKNKGRSSRCASGAPASFSRLFWDTGVFPSSAFDCTLKAVALKAAIRTMASVKRTHKGPLRDILAKNMRRLRAARGLSQEALAYDSGINRTYLSAIERSERNVSIDNIARIAKGLRVDAWRLLRDD